MSVVKFGENNPFHGRTHTDKTKWKMSVTHTGKIRTDETKKKMSAAQTGKTHTVESKQKMSKSRLGEKNHKSKKVYQYDMDNVFVQSFASSRDAAQSINKNSGTNIRKCANGKSKSAHGFKWSYTKL